MDFGSEVIAWYGLNKRTLPWRDTRDPYLIWLSEIILQQTRVDQGLPYYLRFRDAYPSVHDLAAASEDEVLRLWQGLGYYSRGRNLHRTAKNVVADYDGSFPVNYETLIRLKGVGEYTAAAISSFAAGEARAVVDGNVFRLLSRYFGIDTPIDTGTGKREFTALANTLIAGHPPGLFNQAMMEFGSLQCRPKNPDCGICPVQAGCHAFRAGRVHELPVKKGKTAVRDRYFNYIVTDDDRGLLMNKRGSGDIWQNLYDFPLLETSGPLSPDRIVSSDAFRGLFGDRAVITGITGPVRHLLSHQRLHAVFIRIRNFDELFSGENGWFYAAKDHIPTLAKPKLIFAFLNNYPHLSS